MQDESYTKVCAGCKRELDSSEFHKKKRASDRLTPRCRRCNSESDRRYYLANAEERREAVCLYARENQEKRKEYMRRRRRENPERCRELDRNSKIRSPEKIKARSAINDSIKAGKTVRKPCQVCGTKDRVEAHHHRGYEKEFWLHVIWLCKRHHAERERLDQE